MRWRSEMTWLCYQNTNEIRCVIYVHLGPHLCELYSFEFSIVFFVFLSLSLCINSCTTWVGYVERMPQRRSCQPYHSNFHFFFGGLSSKPLTEWTLYLTHNCCTILTESHQTHTTIKKKIPLHNNRLKRLSDDVQSDSLSAQNLLFFVAFRTRLNQSLLAFYSFFFYF